MREEETGTLGTSTVYLCYGNTGQLLYVGVTDTLLSRFQQHEQSKTWWTEVTHIELEHLPDRDAALLREAELIKVHKPKHNVMLNPSGIRRSTGATYHRTIIPVDPPLNMHEKKLAVAMRVIIETTHAKGYAEWRGKKILHSDIMHVLCRMDYLGYAAVTLIYFRSKSLEEAAKICGQPVFTIKRAINQVCAEMGKIFLEPTLSVHQES